MKNWFSRNYKTLIITAFLIPIITVAIVSISHVTTWYGISNPFTWAIYLSIGVEIAALSALAAISADMGKKVYFPFAIVTLVQFIGNIFFSYSFIDINSPLFKDWVDLVSPLVEIFGVDTTDMVGHKRFLAFFAGGMLPVISLSFLHMLVKFTEEDRTKQKETVEKVKETNNNTIVEDKEEPSKVDAKDIVSEVSRLRLTDEDLKKLEEFLLNPPTPNEKLTEAAEIYNEELKKETLEPTKEEIINDTPISVEKTTLNLKQVVFEPEEIKPITQEERKEILAEMMQKDQELGLYDPPYDNPLVKEPVISDDFTIGPEGAFEMTEDIHEQLKQEPITPALSDEEVREMFMDEWERKFDLVEEEDFSNNEPTKEEIEENFSNIEPNSENIIQDNDIQINETTDSEDEVEKKN